MYGEVRGSVVEHVYVSVEGCERAVGSRLRGCKGGGMVPCGVVAACGAGLVEGLFDGCDVVVWFGVGDMESHVAPMSERLAYECGEGPEVVVEGGHEEDVELEGWCVGAVARAWFDNVRIGPVVHDRVGVVGG